jgi:hypothetical protein
VRTITQDWSGLSNETKANIAGIMDFIGGAMLVIGAILAFSGVGTAIGIGLMAMGVANMVTAASLSWNLDKDVKQRSTANRPFAAL